MAVNMAYQVVVFLLGTERVSVRVERRGWRSRSKVTDQLTPVWGLTVEGQGPWQSSRMSVGALGSPQAVEHNLAWSLSVWLLPAREGCQQFVTAVSWAGLWGSLVTATPDPPVCVSWEDTGMFGCSGPYFLLAPISLRYVCLFGLLQWDTLKNGSFLLLLPETYWFYMWKYLHFTLSSSMAVFQCDHVIIFTY